MTAKRIYIAGSSQEMDRAERMMRLVIHEPSLELASDWVALIRSAGSSNPDWTLRRRRYSAEFALEAVAGSDALWLLVPSTPSTGCWVELGAACTARLTTFGSGPSVSLFDSLPSWQYETDEDAFDAIVEWAR